MQRIIRQFAAFCFFMFITYAPSFVAQPLTSQANMTWYHTLNLPSFLPPDWVFSVVWTILYFFMACSAWMIWKRKGLFSTELYWYYGQLMVNSLYMPFFFGYHLIIESAILIGALLLIVTRTLRLFARVDQYAALLLVPYVTWLCFALVIGISVAYLN